MKKLILILTLFLATGCQLELEYDFNENDIASNVSISFILEDYKNYYKNNISPDIDTITNDMFISSAKNDINNSLKAFNNDNPANYTQTESSSNNNVYDAKYKYAYDYSNFKDNYILNYCFENFNVIENDEIYYYSLSGTSICKDATLIISSPHKMVNNNADSNNNGKYSWKINSNDNDIHFSISKNNTISNNISIIKIISISIVIILGIVAYFILNKRFLKKI